MIIRVTFNDNDFTSIIERFFDKPLFLGLKYCVEKYKNKEDDESIRKYVELTKEIDEFLRMITDEKSFTQGQQDRLLNILRESLLDYMTDTQAKSNLSYLFESLEIKCQKSVSDKWENGEVVYYFPMHDTYITM